jgi:hypothetical protein
VRTPGDDEEVKRQRLPAGELGLDIYSMRQPLAAAGQRYVDWELVAKPVTVGVQGQSASRRKELR